MKPTSKEVERLLREDIREKKLAGYGEAKRVKSKRGKCKGDIRFPSDFHQDDKRPGVCIVLTKNRVIRMDLVERIKQGEIVPLQDVENLPFEEGQRVVIALREKFKNSTISKAWGLPEPKISDMFRKKYKVHKTRQGSVYVVDPSEGPLPKGNNKVSMDPPEEPLLKGKGKVLREGQGDMLRKVLKCSGLEASEKISAILPFLDHDKNYSITVTIEEM